MRIGGKVIRLDRVKSTNDVAWREALAGAPDGTCIFAEEQTAGRGRFGRRWHSPRGTGLYLSVLLRRPVPADRVALVTALGAFAVVEAVDDAGLDPLIRFPNDVLVGGRKVAGVLVESRFISAKPDLFVIGVGVNVNQEKFPAALREATTSLRIERGREVSRRRIERSLIESLRRWADRLDGSVRPFRAFWRKHSAILGRKVRVREKGRSFTGKVTEVDPIDGLVVRLSHGHSRGVRPEHVEHLELLS
ncbi:MAG: biotin--[acetyl-CoA-carboxylase] ligase [Planctomycetota bacterium]|jgi:BirA family biotin operon repressor/biotin-[acetyl-CoA-carboxylase] ligase